MKSLRSANYRDDWSDKLSQIISEIKPEARKNWLDGEIDVIRLPGGREILVARGKITEHIDEEFPEWSYIYVAEAGDACFLHVRGKERLQIKAGMVVEFRGLTRHRLEQPRGSDMIWVPFDSKEVIDLDSAYDKIKKAYPLVKKEVTC